MLTLDRTIGRNEMMPRECQLVTNTKLNIHYYYFIIKINGGVTIPSQQRGFVRTEGEE